MLWNDKILLFFENDAIEQIFRVIGVWDQFRLGGGGGGWRLLPEYFLHCLPENQVVLPEYYVLFCSNMANGGGGGKGASVP